MRRSRIVWPDRPVGLQWRLSIATQSSDFRAKTTAPVTVKKWKIILRDSRFIPSLISSPPSTIMLNTSSFFDVVNLFIMN